MFQSNLRLDGSSSEIPVAINEQLTFLSGLKYQDVESFQYKIGTAPGCHEPLLYLFSRLVYENKVKSIIEAGSGTTSIYFSALEQKYKIKYMGLENYTEWYQKTSQAMVNFTGECRSLVFEEETLEKETFSQTEIGGIWDLLFIDSAGRSKRLEVLKSFLDRKVASPTESIIMIDDCEQNNLYDLVVDFCEKENLAKPKMFMSQSRGVAVIDPLAKIDFVENWIRQ